MDVDSVEYRISAGTMEMTTQGRIAKAWCIFKAFVRIYASVALIYGTLYVAKQLAETYPWMPYAYMAILLAVLSAWGAIATCDKGCEEDDQETTHR